MTVFGRPFPSACPAAAVAATIDRRFVSHAVLWAIGSLLVFGIVTAIIPNPVFGRQVPPETFAIAVWLLSAPLMGLLGATYSSTSSPSLAAAPAPLPIAAETGAPGRDGTLIGTAASLGAFLAIGCPVCNKVALVLLGASGAMTVFAPLQPIIGAVSLVLLAVTLAWRLRLRTRGATCSV